MQIFRFLIRKEHFSCCFEISHRMHNYLTALYCLKYLVDESKKYPCFSATTS